MRRPCGLVVSSISCTGLDVGSQAEQQLFVRFSVQPWKIVKETEVAKVEGGKVEWPTANNSVQLDYPGWSGEKESPSLKIEIFHRPKKTFNPLGKKPVLVDHCVVRFDKLFESLTVKNPFFSYFQLAGKKESRIEASFHVSWGRSRPTSPVSPMAMLDDTMHQGGSFKLVDLPEMMVKLNAMYRNACVSLLNEKPIESAFRLYDRNRNGTVNKQDFVKVMRSLEFRLTVQEYAVLMTRLDEDMNGSIHYRKLESFITSYQGDNGGPVSPQPSMTLDDDSRRKLKDVLKRAEYRGISPAQAFKHFDKEGTGLISKSDFQQGLRELGLNLSVRELVLLLKELDKDGDGKISTQEFLEFAELDTPREIKSVAAKKATNSAKEKPKTSSEVKQQRSSEQQLSNMDRHVSSADENRLRELLEKCRLRIAKLERQCASAEANSHAAVDRAVRVAVAHERQVLQTKFVKEVVKGIEAKFKATVQELEFEGKVDLREEAHIAYETLLETEIRNLKAHVGKLEQERSRETRRANREEKRVHKLESHILKKPELFVPKIASLSARNSTIARAFIAKASTEEFGTALAMFRIWARKQNRRKKLFAKDNDKGEEAKRQELITLKTLNEGVTNVTLSQEDMTILEEDLVQLDWCKPFIVSKTEYNYEILANALERCKEWDMYHVLMDDQPEDEGKDSSERPIMPNKLSELVLIASQKRSKEGAIQWFKRVNHHNSPRETGFVVDFETLNDELMHSRVATFNSIKELEETLDWMDQNSPEVSCELVDTWKRTGRVLVLEFTSAVDFAADQLLASNEDEHRQHRIRHPILQKQPDEQDAKEIDAVLDRRTLFLKFSQSEHSSCWAPLATFGREPYDCLRIVNGGKSAEHNTSRSRNVLAYLDGAIQQSLEKRRVFIRMDRSIKSGYWALCVTSAPPLNRPSNGSAVYYSTGEARVEGAHAELGKTILYTDFKESQLLQICDLEEKQSGEDEERKVVVPSKVLLESRREVKTDGQCLERLYSEFAPKRIIGELVCNIEDLLDDKLDRMESHDYTKEEIFLWKARELEVQLIFGYTREIEKTILRTHQSIEDAFKKAKGRMTKKSQTKRISRENLLSAATHLFGVYIPFMRKSEWADLTLPLVTKNEKIDPNAKDEWISFDTFIGYMHRIGRRIQYHFGLTKVQVDKFQANITREISSKHRVDRAHFKPIERGDVVGAKVCYRSATVSFFVNGVLQTTLSPTCRKPWRLAWYTNRTGACTIMDDSIDH